MKLGLGTAQFGLDYGISNQQGQVTREAATHIIHQAAELGVSVVDTAQGYGNSESVLGQTLPVNHAFHIVTKTPRIDADTIGEREITQVLEAFNQSLEHLKQDRVYCLMVHHAENLLKPGAEALFEALTQLKAQGLIQKIGCSFYDRGQIGAVLAKYPIDVIQVPMNIFDQRLMGEGYLDQLAAQGIEIHVRSVLLQGLFFCTDARLQKFPNEVQDKINKLKQLCDEQSVSLLSVLLSYVSQQSSVTSMVLGVTSMNELSELAQAYTDASKVCALDYSVFAIDNESVLNPAKWSQYA
jgi:aryl-alcohol dehydrogenase-like predicted oxidoreductase